MSSGAFALVAGLVYVVLGIAGLFPGALSTGYLGLFPMTMALGALHLAAGVGGLMAASTGHHGRTYARWVAVILGVLGVMGLIRGLDHGFGVLPLYGHNVWLHLGTAAIAVYFGWRARIPVLGEPYDDERERRSGLADRRETLGTVPRERRQGAYDRRMPLGT
jgi:hypothetical protein